MEHYNGAWVASNRGVCIILYGDNVAEATLNFYSRAAASLRLLFVGFLVGKTFF